ncbi:PREDICTED: embryogenesis-associated protein EMB8 isoform X2 [Tarenaya hassleriana]|uniref:embryogenesis-associated protein EMB8 isoform X2 n=1 Tax=Tarenaya hassleriana TaxID=28532 RepID=UPI00053CA522|nr:PREDICTED: embryogenesis-associated protein EMB8 isoform X2 [Tarenaya hassleriana]
MARAAFASSAPVTSVRCLRRPVSASSAGDSWTPETRRHDHQRSLEVIGGGSDRFFPALKEYLVKPYEPFPLVGFNRHVETIFAAFFRSVPAVRLRRECLITTDGGSVALDWVAGDERSLPPSSPVLILLPGLTGGSQDSYVRHMLLGAKSKGWRVVVFNSRGCGNSPVITPQESHNCPLSGAVSLCNPFNLVIADEDFRKGFNNVYDKALARALRRIFRKHALLFEDIGGEFNIPMAANAKTVRDFDEGLTRVSFGFKSVDDYYSNSSSSDCIKYVNTPLLCIQAANDPIAPNRGIPREDIKGNPNCLLVVTPKGGHLGWVGGAESPTGAPWTDPLVMEFLHHLETGADVASSSSSGPESLQIPLDHHIPV